MPDGIPVFPSEPTLPVLPSPVPAPPAQPAPSGCNCNVTAEVSKLRKEIAVLRGRLAEIELTPGRDGKDGKNGKDGDRGPAGKDGRDAPTETRQPIAIGVKDHLGNVTMPLTPIQPGQGVYLRLKPPTITN